MVSDTRKEISPRSQRRTFGGRIRGGIQLLSSISIFAEKFPCEALLSIRIMKENVGSLPFRSPQASEIMRYLLDWICCPDQMCTLRNLHIFRKVLLYILQTSLSTCCYCSHQQLSTQGGNSDPEKQGLQNQGCGSERDLKASEGSSRSGSRGRDQKLHIIGKGPSWRRTRGYLAQINHKLPKMDHSLYYFKTSSEIRLPQSPS